MPTSSLQMMMSVLFPPSMHRSSSNSGRLVWAFGTLGLDLQTSSVSDQKRNLYSCSLNRTRLLVLLLFFLFFFYKQTLQSRCLFTSSLVDSEKEEEEKKKKKKKKKTQHCSIPQHRAHTRDQSFLCRKQSQLCRVRIGSQSERGG